MPKNSGINDPKSGRGAASLAVKWSVLPSTSALFFFFFFPCTKSSENETGHALGSQAISYQKSIGNQAARQIFSILEKSVYPTASLRY